MYPEHNESGIIDTMIILAPSAKASTTDMSDEASSLVAPGSTRSLMTNHQSGAVAGATNTLRHSMVSQYSTSNTTASNSTNRHSFASSLDVPSDPEDNAPPLATTRRWSAEGSTWEHVLSPSSPSSSASLQPSTRFLLSGAQSAIDFRKQELQRFVPVSSPLLAIATSSSSSSSPISRPQPANSSFSSRDRRLKALSDSFVDTNTMPSLLVASPPPPRPAPPIFLPISSSSYISTSTMASNHRLSLLSTPELGHNTFYVAPPASSHASSLPPSSSSSAASASPLADGADPWCISAKQAMDNAVCHDWLYRYEPPSFALARAWKRRVVALVDRSVLVYKSTKATCAAREHFLLTEDTLIFVTEAFKKGCVIEMRKPLCKWYLRCENVDQMKRWLTTMKKAVACLKLGLPGPLTASMLASLTLTDDARLLIDTPLPNTPTTPSLTPNTRLQTRCAPLLASTNQNTTYKRQSYQVSASNITSPVMAHAHTVSHVRDHAKRASTPVFPQHILRSPLQTPSSSPSATAAKRQSLAQIPDWEKQLPPQLPPPTSTLPPLPFAVPIPAQRRQTPTLSASPTSITTTNQPLTTVSEIEIIDPDLHHQ